MAPSQKLFFRAGVLMTYNPRMAKALLSLLISLSVSAGAWAAQPPLTDDQRQQLLTARDYSQQLDEAAWYPLLDNAGRMNSADKAGARYPDLEQLLSQPADFRGELFVIEGLLAAPPRTLPRLARPGPWSGRLQQWVIQTDSETDQVVLLYLVEPPADKERPKVGEPVWIVARFYKVWDERRDYDAKMLRYAVFVGRTVNAGGRGGGGSAAQRKGVGLGGGVSAVIAAVVVMAGGYYILRRRIAAQNQLGSERVSRRRRELEQAPDEPSADETDEPLPEDPVEALRELERRQGG